MLLTHFGPDLPLGYFGLALPMAGRQAAEHCLMLPPQRQAQATEQGTRKGETFAGDTEKTQQDQGWHLCHPFPICSLFVSWRPPVKAKREHACADGQQLFRWDFLPKTGIKGEGHFRKRCHFALSPTLPGLCCSWGATSLLFMMQTSTHSLL